jgi:hypothetical protein
MLCRASCPVLETAAGARPPDRAVSVAGLSSCALTASAGRWIPLVFECRFKMLAKLGGCEECGPGQHEAVGLRRPSGRATPADLNRHAGAVDGWVGGLPVSSVMVELPALREPCRPAADWVDRNRPSQGVLVGMWGCGPSRRVRVAPRRAASRWSAPPPPAPTNARQLGGPRLVGCKCNWWSTDEPERAGSQRPQRSGSQVGGGGTTQTCCKAH